MVEALVQRADVWTGSRFEGGIEPGAMPWKNRFIGNPILTGTLNPVFRTGVGDAHCGMRAVPRAAFDRPRLTGVGMEFASVGGNEARLMQAVLASAPTLGSPAEPEAT